MASLLQFENSKDIWQQKLVFLEISRIPPILYAVGIFAEQLFCALRRLLLMYILRNFINMFQTWSFILLKRTFSKYMDSAPKIHG